MVPYLETTPVLCYTIPKQLEPHREEITMTSATGFARVEMDCDTTMIPTARDELDRASFDSIMQRGLNEAKQGVSRPIADVFSDISNVIKIGLDSSSHSKIEV